MSDIATYSEDCNCPFLRYAAEVEANADQWPDDEPCGDEQRKIEVTFFPNQSAQSQRRQSMTLPELRGLIQNTTKPAKDKLPWLKLATFGDKRSEKNCLRHNANVLLITGIELDYDGEWMTLDAAIEIAERGRLKTLIYTSASYSDATPRWRILLPTSKPLAPGEREKLCARVNGLYGGIFESESFTLSQSYYFGAVGKNPNHRAVVTEGDYIDLRRDLDAGALGKTGKPVPAPDDELNPFLAYGLSLHPDRDRPPPAGRVAAAIAAIPNTDNVDRAQWVRVGMALKAATDGSDEGLELFKQWSESWTGGDYREDYTVAKWKSFKPRDIGAGTLFYLADEASEGWWERAQAVATKDLEVFDAGDDVGLPPPRAWLLGISFARKFLSSILADGGVGKTAFRYAQLIALATGVEITGERVVERCRVLIISLEDDRDELQRRILAVLKHYGIDRSELKGWLFYTTPGAAAGKLMTTDKHGRVIRGKLADTIEAIISAHDIDIVSIDPFVKSHSVEENLNSAIDDVVQILTDLSVKYNLAIDAPHHMSKGAGDPGNANRGRGASAMKDAARLVYTLTPMSEKEAETFEIPEEIDRRQFIRVDSAKVNIAPPGFSARWFQLVSVPLDNPSDLYPNGDHVQTVKPWLPPDVWADLDDKLVNRILAAIDKGLPDGNRYTDGPNAGEREAWNVVLGFAPQKTEVQAKQIIKMWVQQRVLVSRKYDNPVTRKEVKGLYLDPKMGPK
jgi:AAA domain/Primase C terminal 2 (PriCT-2)